jgi:hypothetical protein
MAQRCLVLVVLFLGYWVLFLDYLNGSESWLQIGQLEYYKLATLEITFISYPGFSDNCFCVFIVGDCSKTIKGKILFFDLYGH